MAALAPQAAWAAVPDPQAAPEPVPAPATTPQAATPAEPSSSIWPEFAEASGPFRVSAEVAPLVFTSGLGDREKPGFGAGIDAGYTLILFPWAALSPEAGARLSMHKNEVSHVDATHVTLQAGGKIIFFPDSRFQASAEGGGSYHMINFADLPSEAGISGMGFYAGAGASWFVSRTFSAGGDVRAHFWQAADGFEGSASAVTIVIGLNARLHF